MVDSARNFLASLASQAPVQPTSNGVREDLSKMAEFSIDEYRPMRVVVVGAGMSGVAAGIRYSSLSFAAWILYSLLVLFYRFRQYIPNVDIAIYDKNDGIGGTWYANRYP
jgi:hypothetical protein